MVLISLWTDKACWWMDATNLVHPSHLIGGKMGVSSSSYGNWVLNVIQRGHKLTIPRTQLSRFFWSYPWSLTSRGMYPSPQSRQNISTTPRKSLMLPALVRPSTLGNHDLFSIPYSFAFSRTSYMCVFHMLFDICMPSLVTCILTPFD